MDIFNFQDLTGEFSGLDIVLVMVLSFRAERLHRLDLQYHPPRLLVHSKFRVHAGDERHGGGAGDDDRRLEHCARLLARRRAIHHPLP